MSEVTWAYTPRLDIEEALEAATATLAQVHEQYDAPVNDALPSMKSDISHIVDVAGGFSEAAVEAVALIMCASIYNYIIATAASTKADIANFYGVSSDELTKDGNLLVIGEGD